MIRLQGEADSNAPRTSESEPVFFGRMARHLRLIARFNLGFLAVWVCLTIFANVGFLDRVPGSPPGSDVSAWWRRMSFPLAAAIILAVVPWVESWTMSVARAFGRWSHPVVAEEVRRIRRVYVEVALGLTMLALFALHLRSWWITAGVAGWAQPALLLLSIAAALTAVALSFPLHKACEQVEARADRACG